MQFSTGSEGFLCNVCIVVDIILLHFSVLCDCDETVTLEMLPNTLNKVKDFLLYFHADATFTKPLTFYFPFEIQNMT